MEDAEIAIPGEGTQISDWIEFDEIVRDGEAGALTEPGPTSAK